MDTLTKSCSPTIVITANGEVQTHEEAIVYVKELDIFLTMKILENTLAVLSLGQLNDENGYSYEWINGEKTHLVKDGIQLICNTENFVPIVVPGLSSSSSASSSTLRTSMKQESHSSSSSSSSRYSPTVVEIRIREIEDVPNNDISPVPISNFGDDGSGQPEEIQANKILIPKKKETTIERWNPLDSEILEWLQEVREIWWMMKFHYKEAFTPVFLMKFLLSQLQRDVRIWVNTVFILISLKTEIARSVHGPKLQMPHARDAVANSYLEPQHFGDLITANHKVLSDNCESRNNHRYAVVVQDLATQWFQAYPCKNKTSQETQRSLQKFLEPERKPKVIYTGNSLEFGKSCEDLSWNHCTSTPHRSETNGIAERAVRRRKATMVYCCNRV